MNVAIAPALQPLTKTMQSLRKFLYSADMRPTRRHQLTIPTPKIDQFKYSSLEMTFIGTHNYYDNISVSF